MRSFTSVSRRRFLVASIGLGTAAFSGGPALVKDALAQDAALRFVNSNGVRLRSGPGLSYSIVTTLSNGTRVTAIEQAAPADGYDWTRVTLTVQAGELDGYVASEFLSRSDVGDPGGSEDPEFPIGSSFLVDAAGGQAANLRSAPGTGASVVRAVASGTEGEILSGATTANGYRWFNVAIAGTTGYLADVVIAPGSGGGEPPAFESLPVGSRIVVTDGPLNLRAEPFFGGVIASYPTGSLATTSGDASLPATGDGLIWYPVETDDGRSGFFAASFIGLADENGVSGNVRVVDGPLNLRSEPTTSASILATLSTGTIASRVRTDDSSFFADGYGWTQIQLFDGTGTAGWVAEDFITFF